MTQPRSPSPFRMLAGARPTAAALVQGMAAQGMAAQGMAAKAVAAQAFAAPGPMPVGSLRALPVQTSAGVRLALATAPVTVADGPRVVAFHGGGGDARRFAARTRLHEALHAEGAAATVIYPQAAGHWADGRAGVESGWPADLALAQALAQTLAQTLASAAPLCLAGASNGGMFALRLACALPVPPAAVVAVSAAMPVDLVAHAPNGPPVPLMLVEWLDDPLLPRAGGNVAQRGSAGRAQRGRVLGAEDTVAFWRARNRCTGAPRHRLARISGQRAEIHAWTGGAGGADLWRVVLQGSGHGWPPRAPGAALVGSLEQMAARFLIWFSQKDRPGSAGRKGVLHDDI